MSKKKKLQPAPCADCGAPGALCADMADPPFSLCGDCTQRRIDANIEWTEAEIDINEHLEGGGKLS
jgi:hypothetical protein